MNCPSCEQLVGADQYYWSPLRPVVGPTGAVEGAERDLMIACDHCGVSECVMDETRYLRQRRGPFDPGSDAGRRILARMPRYRGRPLVARAARHPRTAVCG